VGFANDSAGFANDSAGFTNELMSDYLFVHRFYSILSYSEESRSGEFCREEKYYLITVMLPDVLVTIPLLPVTVSMYAYTPD